MQSSDFIESGIIFNLDSKKEDNIYGINLTARFLHISYLLFKNKYAERYYR